MSGLCTGAPQGLAPRSGLLQPGTQGPKTHLKGVSGQSGLNHQGQGGRPCSWLQVQQSAPRLPRAVCQQQPVREHRCWRWGHSRLLSWLSTHHPRAPGLVRAPSELSPAASGSYSVGGSRAGPLGPPQAVPPSKPFSPSRLVQRQAIDAPPGAQDVERPAQGQDLQVPHLTRKRVHRLDVGETEHRTDSFLPNKLLQRVGPSGRSGAPPLRTRPRAAPGDPPRPRRSRSAVSAPGRTRRPAPSRWTGRSPPRGTARGACPPPGPRVGGRSPPSSPRAA